MLKRIGKNFTNEFKSVNAGVVSLGSPKSRYGLMSVYPSFYAIW